VVLGDDNGVVVMPSQLAEEILPECIEHDEEVEVHIPELNHVHLL